MPKKTILLIDHDPLSIKLEKILLSMESYEIHSVNDALEAIKLLESFTPDLILMGMRLPGMSGLELIRNLKSHSKYKNIIIIAVTANALEEEKEQAFAAGVDGYITKPIDITTLPNVIDSYLSKKNE